MNMPITESGRSTKETTAHDSIVDLQRRIEKTVLGQQGMIERLILGLLANGHLLVEGLPGLAKTRAIKKMSHFLDAGLSRIQFTPDLLPSDITGSEIYYSAEGKGEFRFQSGPVFNNLVLAGTSSYRSGKHSCPAATVSCYGDPKSDRTGRHVSLA
jgi:MoxR-like ATPase